MYVQIRGGMGATVKVMKQGQKKKKKITEVLKVPDNLDLN